MRQCFLVGVRNVKRVNRCVSLSLHSRMDAWAMVCNCLKIVSNLFLDLLLLLLSENCVQPIPGPFVATFI
jgi:hypothetical protein